LESLFPADNEVAGWTEDPSDGHPGVAVAHSYAEAEALVDGDADPFNSSPHPFVAFAWQTYLNGTHKADFRIWEMKDAAGCQTTMSYLLENVPTFTSKTWTAESVGDAGKSAQTASFVWLIACKGKYFLEERVLMAGGGAPDSAAHDKGLALIQAVAAKVK